MKMQFAAVLTLLGCLLAAPADALTGVPYLSGRIVDQAGILSTPARDRLSAMLKAHEDNTSNQVVVLTVATLGGESVEDYARRVFEDWKPGQRDKDNGVLMLVVPQDRRMRIEVGYGLEGILTDAAVSRIIRDLMTPRFREGNYDVGIEAGVTGAIQILEGRQPRDPEDDWAAPDRSGTGFNMEAPDMPRAKRIFISLVVFGIIGLFTFIGLVTPGGMGWFLYVFLIPFWSLFPLALFGSSAALGLVIAYGLGFPLAKLLIARRPRYRQASEDIKTKGFAGIGGMIIRPGAAGPGEFSSGGGFSGAGGRSGGASSSW